MTLQIDIFSDAICPWCYVGKRRLEQALRTLGEAYDIRVTWRPFELNPDMPKEGLDRKTYRSRKFGSWERSRAMDAQVAAVGAAEGIPFAFDRARRTPNTFDAHRLVWLAGREGVQDAVVEGVFRGYFTEGKDVGDRATLVEIARGAGLDAERVERFLASDEGAAEVREEEAHGRHIGVHGVPLFVINGTYAVSGAQRPEAFVAAIERATEADRAARQTTAASAAACTVDGCTA